MVNEMSYASSGHFFAFLRKIEAEAPRIDIELEPYSVSTATTGVDLTLWAGGGCGPHATCEKADKFSDDETRMMTVRRATCRQQ